MRNVIFERLTIIETTEANSATDVRDESNMKLDAASKRCVPEITVRVEKSTPRSPEPMIAIKETAKFSKNLLGCRSLENSKIYVRSRNNVRKLTGLNGKNYERDITSQLKSKS